MNIDLCPRTTISPYRYDSSIPDDLLSNRNTSNRHPCVIPTQTANTTQGGGYQNHVEPT